jgi:hypothetical protein
MSHRPLFYWIVSLIIAAGLSLCIGLIGWARPAQAASTPLAFGLRMELAASSNPSALLNAAQIMRANWIAQDVRWRDIEPAPGQYNWTALDALILNIKPTGIRLLLSVSAAPDWARAPNSDLTLDGPPADPAAFAAFMSALATRYRGTVGAYEIWPEANLHQHWSTPEGVSPARYAELLRPAAAAIRAADPMTIIISGGLAPISSGDGFLAMDDLTFYQQLYASGAFQGVDALGAYVDGYNNPPANTPDQASPAGSYTGQSSFYFRHYEAVRAIMVANGDTTRSLWLTSAGWASTATRVPSLEYAADVTEEQQADYLIEALLQAQSQPYLAALIVNNFNYATIPNAPPSQAAYSLLNPDWSARPAFPALAQARQGNSLIPLPPTPSQPIHVLPNWQPRLRYTFFSE